MYTLIDFCVFGLSLALAIVVGIYHAIMSKYKSHQHTETAEFLTGGRKLPMLPVCLSLMTTFISGIALLGLPAEIYQRGSLLIISFLCGSLSFFIAGYFFVPIFYKMQFVSVYEYFEMRYDSVLLRRIGSLLFLFATLFYMAVVLYSPAIALVGIIDAPLWPFILAIGIVSTIYTAIGGIKAVIWTDTLQAGFMYLGIGILLVKGTLDAGGLGAVFEVAERTGRISGSVTRMDWTPFQYNSLWIMIFGGIIHWTCYYGLNQMALQRYCSMPSLSNARSVMWMTVPAFVAIGWMCCFIGILMIGYFHGCDPKALGLIDSMDQMVILFAGRVLSIVPGLPGLFLSSIFGSTLSTVSSGINSMTAVLWEDFLKDRFSHWSEAKITKLMKVISVVIGLSATALSFVCDYMGGIFSAASSTLGALAGPLVGLFFLGVFFPRANKHGALAGLITAMVFMVSCAVMYNVQQPYTDYSLPLEQNPNNPNCIDFNVNVTGEELSVFRHEHLPHEHPVHVDWHFGNPDTYLLARLSYFLYAGTGVIIVVVVGYVVSILFPLRLSSRKQRFAEACTLYGVDLMVDKSSYRSVSIYRDPAVDPDAGTLLQPSTKGRSQHQR